MDNTMNKTVSKTMSNWIKKETTSAAVWTNVAYPGFRIVKTDSSDYFTVQHGGQIKGSFESEENAKNSFWFV